MDLAIFSIPAEKTGWIIGTNGRAIRKLMENSGAWIHIFEEIPPDPSVKIGYARGKRTQIEQALR